MKIKRKKNNVCNYVVINLLDTLSKINKRNRTVKVETVLHSLLDHDLFGSFRTWMLSGFLKKSYISP